MRVVVTRPAQEAARWVEALRARGHDAFALPLIAIGPAPEVPAVRQAFGQLAQYAAVMFVSANAVEGFFAAANSSQWPAATRAWAPGPATGAALRAARVPAAVIAAPAGDAAQFDSESLWAQVGGQLRAGDRLLLVRGAGGDGRGQGREWLSQQLAALGVQVDTVVAYTRGLPHWTASERRAAERAAAGSLWLFSSSEAAANLQQLLPQQAWSGAQALATHPRIAEAVRAMGFGEVREIRPALADVVASIESAR